MSFSQIGLQEVASTTNNHFKIWHYSTSDPLLEVTKPNYFVSAWDTLSGTGVVFIKYVSIDTHESGLGVFYIQKEEFPDVGDYLVTLVPLTLDLPTGKAV